MSKTPQKSQVFTKVAECLYRNGNGIYFAKIKVKGKKIKSSLKTSDREIAGRRLQEYRKGSKRVHGSEQRNIRFGELTQLWLESIKSEMKASSHKRRETSLRSVSPFFELMPVRAIGYNDIDNWKKQRAPHVSARTYNIDLETLGNLFEYAINRDIITENPTAKFKRRKGAKKEIDTFSREQFSMVMDDLDQSPKAISTGGRDMIEFLAFSGQRVGEAREIRLHDVRPDKGTIRITGGANLTKNHKERTIPIFPALKPVVMRLLEKIGTTKENVRIFNLDTPRKALDLCCARLDLPHHSIHSLRHFFVTNAIENGANDKTIANWIGHSDGGILVAKTYGHLRKEFAESAATKMTFDRVSSQPDEGAEKK